MNLFHVFAITLSLMVSFLFRGCVKEPVVPQTGQVMFWVASDLGCGYITVNCNGESKLIQRFYSSGVPSCDADGMATFTMAPGEYSFTASCNGKTWGNPVTVTSGGCTAIQLTASGGGGSGSTFNPNLTYGSVSDISGNVYKTIKIGTKTWMAENLRTTKYRDGSNIPIITDNSQWANNFFNNGILPMMCWYDNDQATYIANKFGALYNWYAINPATNGNKNVCPTGWHVPTDAEWNLLISNFDPSYDPTTITSLAGNGVQSTTAGAKMKSTGTQYWQSPNTGATNSSGFSALPGGDRWVGGKFEGIGHSTIWWSSTESNNEGVMVRFLLHDNGNVNRSAYHKSFGMSVRCVRD